MLAAGNPLKRSGQHGPTALPWPYWSRTHFHQWVRPSQDRARYCSGGRASWALDDAGFGKAMAAATLHVTFSNRCR
jgi:hypothetical protein